MHRRISWIHPWSIVENGDGSLGTMQGHRTTIDRNASPGGQKLQYVLKYRLNLLAELALSLAESSKQASRSALACWSAPECQPAREWVTPCRQATEYLPECVLRWENSQQWESTCFPSPRNTPRRTPRTRSQVTGTLRESYMDAGS